MAQVIDGELEVASCPACQEPCKGPIGDGSEYSCTACEWRGDGYQTLAPSYPSTPQKINRFGFDELTGGRVGRRRYKSLDTVVPRGTVGSNTEG